MLKSLALAFNFLIVLILTTIFGSVSVNTNIPEKVQAGDQFTVSVTIDKSNIGDFGRYQMELPNGFQAEVKDANGGAFSYENEKVRINWLQLPYDDRFAITFDVTVPPKASGDFEISSSFSYVKDNSPTIEELPVHTLTVEGSESVEDLTAANTYKFQGVRMKEVDCIRQKPYLNENDEIIVNLLVMNKVGLNKFGKIQEQIPRGYKAISLRSKNAMFTNNGRILKFMWMQLPEDEFFVVTYKLIQTEDIPNQAFLISGEFTFTRNDRNQVVDIAERNVDLEEFAEEDLIVDNTPIPDEEDTRTNLLGDTDNFGRTTQTNTGIQDGLADNTTGVETGGRDRNTKTGSSFDNYTDNQKQTYQETNYAIAITNGVTYRVQVAAGHKLVKDNYFKRLNLKEEVQIEIHQGWHKYTVGSHGVYKDARDHRNLIWQNTPIDDAFVCAYNSGQRITVQEALMIANQKWYK
ncbi:MAG: hypothetical protein R6U85_07255 [Salinivirgaceae bacterium]